MEVMYAQSEGSTFDRFKETGRVFQLLLAWSMAQEDLGTNDLGAEAFKDWAESSQSRSTSDRQLRSFRSIFKGEQNPNRIAQALREQAHERGEKVVATMRVSDSLLIA